MLGCLDLTHELSSTCPLCIKIDKMLPARYPEPSSEPHGNWSVWPSVSLSSKVVQVPILSYPSVNYAAAQCRHVRFLQNSSSSRRSWFYRPSCHLISQSGGFPAIWQVAAKRWNLMIVQKEKRYRSQHPKRPYLNPEKLPDNFANFENSALEVTLRARPS